MQTEAPTKVEAGLDSTDSNIVGTDGPCDSANGAPNSTEKPSSGTENNKPSNNTNNSTNQAQFPPPKTDKPRPHVCGTCGRSFARLEHLKRHERSHTKEKPFQCPECARCFARRDLLLRHQQKLHATNSTSSRPRSNGRRESVSGASVAGARVRKNSVANASLNGAGAGAGVAGAGVVRPRANTISHIDLSNLGISDNGSLQQPSMSRLNALGLGNAQGLGGGLGAGMNNMGFDYRGMSTSTGHHGNLNGLPKLDTSAINNNSLDGSNSLRTAPPQASFGGFHVDQIFGPGNTINPAQLHFGGGGSTAGPHATMSSMEPFTVHSAIDPSVHSDDFGWMRSWSMQMPFDGNENAIDESSPSRLSSGDSPPEFPENLNGHGSTAGIAIPNNLQWPLSGSPQQGVVSAPFHQLDGLSGAGMPGLDAAAQGMVEPDALHDPTPRGDAFFHQAMMQQQQMSQMEQQQQQLPPELLGGHVSHPFAPSISNLSSDSPSIMSSSSMGGSARQSSVTSASTLSITDATRAALLHTLTRSPGASSTSTRKYSQPAISSPLSPNSDRRSPLSSSPNLPSTDDMKRYVDAFIQHAHPHMPVTHMPTLSFDPLDFFIGKGPSSHTTQAQTGLLIGGGCLILGMAAIGALYEYEYLPSKELFEASKRMIHISLDERRKPQISAAVTGAKAEVDHQTPLWLVQAMLLTVIYGYLCGDKTAADIASTHCAALVGLARAAKLAEPPQTPSPGAGAGAEQGFQQQSTVPGDIDMGDDGITPGDSISRHQSQETDLHAQWITWKVAEERKRTLFAIFILSSLLTTAYNQHPLIMNSEILLDLPCDEELFSAESAQKWQERGGMAAAEINAVSFAGALSNLLTANQRQASKHASGLHNGNGPFGAVQHNDAFVDNDLRPSTFGCLVLINALHNYIWETRSRHHGRQWTPQETESMFSHIEPALNAWQAAWKANEQHRLERPNPLGAGPLAADSIPLLDQAFVRLFVNLGASKEAFWRRDFDGMAEELARGVEIVQHADGNEQQPGAGAGSGQNGHAAKSPKSKSKDKNGDAAAAAAAAEETQRRQFLAPPTEQTPSRREKHLRKAAFYAADSLTIACNYNLTYTDLMSHELPVQSAMCFFDCCQVLAEWAVTVQERVGRYVGVLGRDQIDLTSFPGFLLLEQEDLELFGKVERICEALEGKRWKQERLLADGGLGLANQQQQQQPQQGHGDMQQQQPHGLIDNGVVMAGTAMGIQMGTNPTTSQQMSADLAMSGYGSKLLRITGMMLEKALVWPITLVMVKSLQTQAEHMDRRAEASTRFQESC